jgi:hypothetical protein
VHAATGIGNTGQRHIGLTIRELMIKKLAGTFFAAGALLVLAAPAAQAAAPEPFTIAEDLTLNRFEATGALCDSGTFEDEVHAAGGNASGFNELFRTVYTCDNGDTFFAQKHLHLVFNADGSITNVGGPITLSGGTGDFTRLSGHGVDTGSIDAQGNGHADISGVLAVG